MSQNYKMIIQYEGTRYDGWQKQGNTENTIQGKLEKVLERMAGFPVEVHGLRPHRRGCACSRAGGEFPSAGWMEAGYGDEK